MIAFLRIVMYNIKSSVHRTSHIFPGVAQLVARLLWEQDAAGSNPVTRTKSPESAYAESGLFSLYEAQLELSNATRTSVAGKGLT